MKGYAHILYKVTIIYTINNDGKLKGSVQINEKEQCPARVDTNIK